MSLVTYQQARPWARSIKARVSEHSMPPFQIDKTVGVTKFKNDDSLSDAELDTIVKWVDAGAPQGDPKDMPPAVDVARRPGLELRQGVRPGRARPGHQVARVHDAGGGPGRLGRAGDRIGDHRAALGAGDRDPAETLKGRKITHHAIAYLQQDDPTRRPPASLPVPFMEWAVGKQGEMMRPDTGKLLLPGSKFRWDIHYSQAGEEITSNVEMGIYFYPKGQEPKYRNTLSLVPAALGTLDIRPNTITVTEGFFPLRDNARIESFQPHMHLRGKAMMVEAVLPTGQRQVLSHVDNFNFQWMTTFVYADDAAPLLPKGTLLKVTAWHDNTTAKKSNPDPNQWVGWGDRTVDEMAHAWINIVYLKDDEFKAEQERRKTVHDHRPPTASSRRRASGPRVSRRPDRSHDAGRVIASGVSSSAATPPTDRRPVRLSLPM